MKTRFLIALIGLLIMGCASTPNTHFYIIDLPLENQAEISARFPVSLGIERLHADAPYSDDRLIFRESVYEVKFYHYHRWVMHPAEMITDKLFEKIKSTHLFQNVNRIPGNVVPDYLLSGRITALEEWDEDQRWYGQVQLSLTLLKYDTNDVVWQKDFNQRVPSAERKPMAVVKAMSTSLNNCLKDVVSELEQYFRK